ncbi:MAG: xylose isomerase [Planctomycetota bacterium]
MAAFQPTPEDRFTFGLWTVGNPGRDPFGGPVRERIPPARIVEKLAELGACGVNLHDEDLIPFGASAAERDAIVAGFRRALDDHGLEVPMVTTNLFSHPIFKDGAFTADDPRVRAFARRKAMDAIDLGVELGAEVLVCWGGREGAEADARRDPRTAIARYREAIDYLCGYCLDQGYSYRFALEAKPNEPRGDIYLATTGHMLHFITTLAHPEMVGVNPEVAHEQLAGLNFVHNVAQALEADKLFHIDLNAQRCGRYDQDLRFGSEDLKGALLLVRMLEGTAGTPRWEGSRHFDAHAYRTEDEEGVWEFARGCMRTYLILKERARAFDADPEVAGLLAERRDAEIDPLLAGYSPEGARALRALPVDADAIGREGLGHERLDQLLVEHLLGARG